MKCSAWNPIELKRYDLVDMDDEHQTMDDARSLGERERTYLIRNASTRKVFFPILKRIPNRMISKSIDFKFSLSFYIGWYIGEVNDQLQNEIGDCLLVPNVTIMIICQTATTTTTTTTTKKDV